MKGGTLVGGGPVDFDSKSYTFVITGGTGKYQRASGHVTSAPVAGYAITRLTLTFS
jgi:hypothetical protein